MDNYTSQILKERFEKNSYLGKEETDQLEKLLFKSRRKILQHHAYMRYKKRLQGLLPKSESSLVTYNQGKYGII